MRHIYVAGFPKGIGGANTELWHTIKLWRAKGWDVTLIPTVPSHETWEEKVTGIGCKIWELEHDQGVILNRRSMLDGQVIVSFCNDRWYPFAGWFREAGAKIVSVPCMCWPFPQERLHYDEYGLFDAYVFQSQYQHDRLTPQYRKWAYTPERGRLIRGAFDVEEFPFQPASHREWEQFVVGKIARCGSDKWPVDLWDQYRRINYPIRARVMGFGLDDQALVEKLGDPPPCVEAIPEEGENVIQFYGSLHCLIPGLGGCVENWPRIALEAASCGVPVVAEGKGGWLEMAAEGLVEATTRPDHQAYLVERLAYDEGYRLQKAVDAREAMECICNPESIAIQWDELFRSLGA